MVLRERYIPENTAIAVVDFDNVVGDFFEVNEVGILTSIVNNIINVTIGNDNQVENCLVRLYGGWFFEGQYTNRASTILQNIGSGSFFPVTKNKKIQRGAVELARSINAIDDLIWENTYVKRHGLPHLRLDLETLHYHCNQDNQNCPARLLKKFTKSKNKKMLYERLRGHK